MHGCDNHTAVMDALRKLFVHVSEQGGVTLADRTVRFCLFKRLRAMLVERQKSRPHVEFAVDISWAWNSGHYNFSLCQREAIYLKLYAGFNFYEIAAIVSTDINEVYRLVSSGIEYIRKSKQELNKSILPTKRLEVLNEL
jgi:hypothetical protein